MNSDMTELSRAMYDEATSDFLTVQDAVEYLEKEGRMRTLREKLEKFAYGRDLQTVLTEGLMKNHPDLSKDSARKRVRGWLTSDSRSLEKPDAIEVCFILKLSLEEADQLVASIAEEGLHWRSPDEIIYIFALKQGMDYLQARAFNEEMGALLKGARADYPQGGVRAPVKGGAGGLSAAGSAPAGPVPQYGLSALYGDDGDAKESPAGRGDGPGRGDGRGEADHPGYSA